MSLPHLGVAVVTCWSWLAAVVLYGGDRQEGEVTSVGLNNTGTFNNNDDELVDTKLPTNIYSAVLLIIDHQQTTSIIIDHQHQCKLILINKTNS